MEPSTSSTAPPAIAVALVRLRGLGLGNICSHGADLDWQASRDLCPGVSFTSLRQNPWHERICGPEPTKTRIVTQAKQRSWFGILEPNGGLMSDRAVYQQGTRMFCSMSQAHALKTCCGFSGASISIRARRCGLGIQAELRPGTSRHSITLNSLQQSA